MNLPPTTTDTASCLEDTFICNIAQSVGRSNTEILSWDADTAIEEARPRIKDELDALDEEIAKLLVKRSEIFGLAQSLDVAQAVHKRLPLDVLTHIFSMVAEGSELSISNVRAYPPWVIRSVCSHWRKVALEQRTLWNAIILQPKSYVYAGGARIVDWHKKITRTLSILPSETDVSITLHMNPDVSFLVEDAFKKLILPLSFRLRTLVLIGGGLEAFAHLFRMPFPTSFPALTTLKLVRSWGTEGLKDFRWLDGTFRDGSLAKSGSQACLLSSAPNLHTLDVIWETSIGFQELFKELRNRVRWENLTHLQVKGGTCTPKDDGYMSLRLALTAATNLRRLSLELNGGLSTVSQTQDMITFPHLQNLHVRSFPLPDIFDSLILPSLRHLVIQGVVEDKALRRISAMITRSSCSLVSFEEQSALGDRRRHTATAFFTEFITRCGDLMELKTSREITPHLLYRVATQELLGRCGFQKWKVPSDLSIEGVVSTIADGLERHSSFGREKSKYRILVLEPKDNKEAEAIQSSSSRFRPEYGLELRSFGSPQLHSPQRRLPRPGPMRTWPSQGSSNLGSASDLFSPEFINSVASPLDEFDSNGLFRPDDDFERDFGQWFNQDDVNGLNMN